MTLEKGTNMNAMAAADDTRSATSGELLQLVSFKIGGEEFGVDILQVQEINDDIRKLTAEVMAATDQQASAAAQQAAAVTQTCAGR